MKRNVSVEEIWPFYDATLDAGSIGFGVDLTEEEWADHDRVVKESTAWQDKLEDLYEAAGKAWWDGLTDDERTAHKVAWSKVR